MNVAYHPAVQRDLNSILQHYDGISSKLGDGFWNEFMVVVRAVAQNPERYPFITSTLRRVNLPRYPHHFLFRLTPNGVRIVVLRHNKRHPNYGLLRN